MPEHTPAPLLPTQEEKTVIRMIEAVNGRDFDALDALIAPDVVRHCAATPDVEVRSLEEFKAFLRRDLSAVPDAMQELDLIFSSGPFVAARVIYRGTQDGRMGPFPPSGKKLEVPFLGILRVENGKIVEIWTEWDNLNALAQLGHLPPGPATR
jgi:predicted ester cyclase